jgi:hypothetical protein
MMKLKLSGSVHFANDKPAPGVKVQIFDKDMAGKEDDDLTISPGLTDERGFFSLTYEPLRYLDFHTHLLSILPDQSVRTLNEEHTIRLPDIKDAYLPYLRFDYTFGGVKHTHTASMELFQKKYYLPEFPAVAFKPSSNGFGFVNKFAGYFLPFSTPSFMRGKKVSSQYGLCGGMCAAAYDFALAGQPAPSIAEVPKGSSRLHRYLFRRQIDSFGGLGQEIVKVAQWTSLPDDTLIGTMRRTADELPQIRQKLDLQNPVILALIYVHASSLLELSRVIFNNHQVLAYAYHQDDAGGYTINIYDPNLPGRDDVAIRCVPVTIGVEQPSIGSRLVIGLKSTQLLGGDFYRDVRGFFEMPYTPMKPPKGI